MTTFLSVCDGMGCAHLAFTPLGWRQVLSSEIEAAPRSVLQHHIDARDIRLTKHADQVRVGQGVALWGDFSALRIRHLVRFGVALPDVLCGGTPCQDFSVAGLRAGLGGERGNLTLHFIRLANAIDAARAARGLPPIIIFWENVPGVLNHRDNPFGNVLAALVGEDAAIDPVRGRWTDAGLAIGPRRAAAWRKLDTQYFGLPQRRERVFVVASARAGFDPAAVLLESEGLRRDSPPRREAGTRVAPTIAGGARERGGFGYDDIPLAEAFGGNDTRGPIDVATCLSSHGGPHGRLDFETETFIAEPVCVTGDRTHALTAEGFDASEDGTGRGPPIVAAPVAYSIMPQNSSRDYKAREVDVAQPLMAGGPVGGNQGGDYVVQPLAFNAREETVCTGDVAGALGASSPQAQAIAFALRGREGGAMPEVEGDGNTVGTLQAAEGGSSRDYVAFAQNQRDELRMMDIAGALAAEPGMKQHSYVYQYGVRRLTPRECCRLQGVPDDYFDLVLRRGKPLADGPIYKMLGNGWSIPVIAWIGARIDAELAWSADRVGAAA